VACSGETLLIIAKWYTGSPRNWQALARTNPELDPVHLKIGDSVRIPLHLLRTTAPMPETFVASQAKKSSVAIALDSPEKSVDRYFVHRVRWPGETLITIARWYTGDPENWQSVAQANPSLNPDHINIGDTIRIPRQLLNTSAPMPEAFVAASLQKTPAAPQPARPAPVKPEEPEEVELFGPK